MDLKKCVDEFERYQRGTSCDISLTLSLNICCVKNMSYYSEYLTLAHR